MKPGSDNALRIETAAGESRAAALELVLRDATPQVRAELAASEAAERGLLAAYRRDNLVGAIWYTPLPGHTAALWPPRTIEADDAATARLLLAHTLAELDRLEVQLAQVLLPSAIDSDAAELRRAGFQHLAELVYLFRSVAGDSPRPLAGSLEFEPVPTADSPRLAHIVERTYEGTRDCPQLNGVRSMSDVLAGYAATGDSRNALWRIVRRDGSDVGCLLLADHAAGDNLELVYMGLAPEARGRQWGAEILAHARHMTREAGRANLVLAVDAANAPALSMYYAAGMVEWERRNVFVRIHQA